MKIRTPLLITGAALLGAAIAMGQAPPRAVPQGSSTGPGPAPAPGRFDESAVDRTADPCVDFYQYACGAWMKGNPIPADQPDWGRHRELALRNQRDLREVLDRAAAPGRPAGVQQIGDHYASCMDEAGVEKLGLRPLLPDLQRIEAVRGAADLAPLLARLHLATGGELSGDSGARTVLFGFSSSQDFGDASQVVATFDQGGLGLPDRDYYLKDDARSVQIRKDYQAHLGRMLALLMAPAAQAAEDARAVVELETALARASMDVVRRRDAANLNHKMSLAEVQALAPSFDFGRYLQEVGAPRSSHYLVYVPEFFRGVEALLKGLDQDKARLGAWRAYLRWHLVHDSADLLPAAFVKENFAFYGKLLRGAKEVRPRWRRCVARVDRDLGEALGQAYVERTLGAEGKERMLRLVRALSKAMKEDIQGLSWMSPATKKEAQAKLTAIENKIGYPDRFRDYSSVRIVRGDLWGNAARASEFEVRRQLAKIGKPVDRTEWLMTPATVNAYYDPQLNTINFPAGILQPPYFDKTMDDAVNLGAIGAVIGHELTHGFDDEGRKFDARGNLRDWWTKADAREFERRAQCLTTQYGEYTATEDVKLNGKLTLGENTADAGGLRIAFMAMRDLLGPAQAKEGDAAARRFFLSFGQSWCANLTPELLRIMAATNPHSPPRYRVNGVLSNMPEFARAFSCRAGQPMVRKNACRVW
jgi:endothelin-converting enzyme/putative endopeptidase